MSTDFRALCAELADVLAELPFGTCEELVVRARAALMADGPAVPEGHQPAPPAAGEVAELVAWLRLSADCADESRIAENLSRAADLLTQRHPAPVPVSERLPGPGDCDAEGRCWLLGKTEKEWRLIEVSNSGVPHLRYCFSHWLPAHALPLPAGEVGHG